jgi:hypothetical protein
MRQALSRSWPLNLPCRRGSLVHFQQEASLDRVPRLARLMALAIRLGSLLRQGTVADQAELARLGHVSRARISQILNLLHLAPDIQEELLFLPPIQRGRERLHLADLQPLCRHWNWRAQRRLWHALKERLGLNVPNRPEKP